MNNLPVDRLVLGSCGGEPPCNPAGGSPSLHKAITRVTGSILTGPDCLPVRNCSLTSVKSICVQVGVRRRVDRPSHKKCTKGIPLLQLPILSLHFFVGVLYG